MKRFLRFTNFSVQALVVFAALASLITLAAALWLPLPNATLSFFDVEYDAQTLAATGFIEWMLLFLGTAVVYMFATLGALFALAFGGSVVVFSL
jgi:hypothetical protein